MKSQYYLLQHQNDWCPDRESSPRKRRRVEQEEEEKAKDYGFEPILEAIWDEMGWEEGCYCGIS